AVRLCDEHHRPDEGAGQGGAEKARRKQGLQGPAGRPGRGNRAPSLVSQSPEPSEPPHSPRTYNAPACIPSSRNPSTFTTRLSPRQGKPWSVTRPKRPSPTSSC